MLAPAASPNLLVAIQAHIKEAALSTNIAQPIVMKKLTPHLDKAIFASCVLSKAL